MEYSEEFKTAVREDILRRMQSEPEFAETFMSLPEEKSEETRGRVYAAYAKKPEFAKLAGNNGSYLSKVIDDLGNIPQAWRAGNFYSYGGWSDLASTLIDDVNPLQSGEGAKSSAARREELYQNYRKWREENPAPENKTLLGDVATGAAGLVPLFVDMNIEAAAPALAAAGISAGIGAAAGGAGAVPAGVAGGLLGYKASMATQSGKVALADIYTSLRDEGFDDATSAAWAYRLAVPYGALEYAGRALAPVSRLALGSGGLRGVIDKIADKGVKNKILNYAAKAGMDIAATGTAESAVEAAQAAMVEGAKQGAGGEEFDAGKMAQAAAEEFKDAAPAMYGMALLGIVPQAGARRAIERVKTGGDKRNAPAAPENAAQPFGGDAAAEAGRQAEGAGGAGVWDSPEAGGQGGVQFGEAEAGGGTRQGGLQFGEAGGSPRADYFIYGADGNLVGTSREPAILPTSGGIYYDSYASAFADAGRRGAPPAFSDGRKVYAILPVESDGRVFYYAAEYDPQAGRRNVELLENPPQGAGGAAGPEWLGAQMQAFIEKRRENPDAGPRPYASEPFTGADGVENVPINFARERVGGGSDEAVSAAEVVENSQKNSRRKVRYEELDDFLENGIVPGESSFYDFGELAPETVERIKAATGKDLSGYVHALDSFGVLHGERKHGSSREKLRGQIPVSRNDWKLAEKVVNDFDNVKIEERATSSGNDVLVFNKKIGDTVYYVAEIRTGRKKLVSATMWKQKEKTIPAGDSILSDPSRPQRFRNLSSLNSPSENASESQGENLNFYAAPRVSEERPANADGGGRAGAGGRGISDKSGYKKYYDLSLVEDGEKPLSDREVKRTNRDFPDSGFSDLPSENISESQGENLNFYAAPRVSEGRPANADGGGRAGAGGRGISASARAYLDAADSIEAINAQSARAARRKAENDAERGIKRRGVLRKISDRTKLPSGVKLDKKTGRLAGLANPAEIRRYLAKALDVGVYPGMDVARHKNALGTYNNLLEIVRLRGGHINDMNVVGHELGHHLERLMFDYHLPDADTPLKRELERFCVSRFGNAYPPKLRAREGWAQFVSEWIANPQAAEVEAPIAGAAMRQLSRAFPKIGKILDNAREMLSLWQNADPNAKTEANIKFSDEARPREGEGVVAFLKRLYEQGQLHGADRLYGLKNAQRIVNDRTGESADFYEQARTMKGAASENSQWSREVRQTDLNGEEIGESLEEICAEKNTGVSLRRFEAYLVARRAMAYYRRNPEESADTCRAKFGNDYATLSKVEQAATDKMRVAALRLDKFQKNSLKLLLDGGVIDMRTFERLSVQKGYVPLRRIMEELDAAESGGGGGLKKPLKNFHGSDREIISPIAQIADNEQFFRQLAMKNRLYSQIVDSIMWLPRGGELLSDYKDTSEKVNINYKEFAKSLAKSEFAREIAELDGIDWSNERELVAYIEKKLRSDEWFMPAIWKARAMADDSRRVLTYFDGGRARAFQVHDKLLYDAFKAMDDSSFAVYRNFVVRFLDWAGRGLAQIQRSGAVLNPNFSFGNIARDITAGLAYSRHGEPLTFFANWLWYGLPASLGFRKELVGEWRREGGSFGSFYGDRPGSAGRQFAEKLDLAQRPLSEKAGILAKRELQSWAERPLLNLAALPLRGARGALWGLSKIGSATERAARVTEFKLAKDDFLKDQRRRLAKEHPQLSKAEISETAQRLWSSDRKARRRAAVDSRDISLDFESGGLASKWMNRYSPFFNVAVLATRRFFSELIPVDVPAALEFLETVDWRSLSADAEAFRNFVGKSKPEAARAVKIFARNAAVFAIAAAVQAACMGPEEDELSDWEKNRYVFFRAGGEIFRVPISPDLALFFGIVKNVVRRGFRPEEPADWSVWRDICDMFPGSLPPPLKALLEWLTGYSFFRGRPIEGAGMQNRLPSDRISSSTSSTSMAVARWLSDGLGIEVSPAQVDNAVQNIFAGLGTTLVKTALDPLAERAAGLPSKPDSGIFSAPGLGAFRRNPYSPSRYVADFAETARTAEQYVASGRISAAGRMPERELSGENLRKALWYRERIRGIRRMNQVLGEYNAQAARVRNSDDSPKEKDEQLRALTAAKNRLAKAAFEDYDYEYNKRRRASQ